MKNYYTFIAIVFVMAVLLLSMQNVLPAVRVSGQTLSYTDFYRDRDGLVRYNETLKGSISDSEIDKSVITSFVSDALITSELENRGVSESDINKLVDGALATANSAKLEDGVMASYAWTINDLKQFVLNPQAREELLTSLLSKENVQIKDWLSGAVKIAKVSIYLPRWKWQNGGVVGRY